MTKDTMTLVLLDASRHGRELPPAVLRPWGLRAALAADIGLREGEPDAVRLAQNALRALVDAFLGDRVANRDLFYRAHVLGRQLSETVGCRWEAGAESYSLQCPIFALHRGLAHSLAMTVTTECSICGAGTFECDHVPGEEYDGQECFPRVLAIGSMGHIAWTAEPEFIYTWHQPQTVETRELVADGIIQRAGDPAVCTHCQDCGGQPSADNLDPVARFERLVAENA